MSGRFQPFASKTLLVLLLLIGSVLGNVLKLPLFYDVDFLFGSICTMLLMIWFPFPFGLASAFLAGGYTYLLWNHPYALIIIVGEAIFVRIFLFRTSDNLVLIDTAYWALIGMPLVYGFYHVTMGMAPSSALLVMFKQGVNGIFNALIASLVSLGVLRIPVLRRSSVSRGATYRNLLFLVLTSLVLFPALISTVVFSRYEYAESKDDILQIANRTVSGMKEVFSTWMTENFQTVEALGRYASSEEDFASRDSRRLLEDLRESNPSFLRLGLCDERAVSVAVEPPQDDEGRPTAGIDYSDRPFVQELRATRVPQISEVIVSRVDRKTPLIVMTYPVARGRDWRGYAFGSVDLREVSARMRKIIRHWNASLTVTDKERRVVFSTANGPEPGTPYYDAQRDVIERESNGLLLITNKVRKNVSVMQRWQDSSYAKMTSLALPVGWNLLVEVPVAPFMRRLFRTNLQHMSGMMALVLLTVLLAQVLSRRMVSSIAWLQRVTTHLPDRIQQGGRVKWPESGIFEVRLLVDNFKAMSRSLSEKFQELKATNDELKRAKEAAEGASRAKSDFLAVMSHEIRTPMNAVLGMTEVALQEDLDPGVRDHVETIRGAALVLLGIINNVLDFAKIESGRLGLEEIDFDLYRLVNAVIRTMQGECDRKGLRLSLDLGCDVPAVLKGDPVRLQQILVNLIGNAVKFTERGSVRVVVRRWEGGGPGDTGSGVPLVLAVEDTGPGISEDKRDVIFQSFRQADSTTSRKYGGSGLGLAICQRLAALMGGRMEVESEVGRGSRFSAYLVLSPGDAQALDSAGSSVPADCAARASVLLAEDNPVNAKVAVLALGRQGHRVTHVSCGEEVLRALESESFDVVLMDLEMPGLDGLDTTQLIRNGRAGDTNRRVPIVAMTAHALSGYREKCLAAGMDDYLSKPVDFGQLNRILQRLLAGEADRPAEPKVADAPPSHQTSLDWSAAMERVDGDEALLKELCRAFLQDLEAKIARIARAIAESDFEDLARMGHTLKGSAGVIAAERCALLAKALEKAGTDRDKSEAERVREELAAERNRLEEIICAVQEATGGGS